ncbi:MULTISPECIES: M20/M25/M40 family metallo-hydrolase [Pseudoalteromonas distincta group]|jgi:carboxypeptidase Q|uniref:M20/M25/M40 family metallo-hydrolase n=1 Tax=Pseudoalteromonas TaxID=53246 RepID=UPI00118F51E7|nr:MULTISPECIES: M20/M25/M40 family metallo-hydrolase [Pseudoalteromonas distincta group]TVU72596.1 M20/M25/M40 family metallo-hydrolase [Pseudoalteromonas elyakovii]|tara:strand:- start:435 stop:1835 length:1401 start_codon:yes stop_codon:yes gene_type:complete
MKKLITALLLTSSMAANANNAEFTQKQLQQVNEVRTSALNSDLSYKLLESLTTEVGPRLPGTENDKKAVAWAKAKFNELGFDKVWLEEATFPEWRRYSESGKILTPSEQPLHLTALGNSISTPKDGITAPVVLFETLDELIAAPANSLKGKIAYINYRMNRDIDGNGYGPAVKARGTGAIEASKKGAVAYMMRSVSTGHHRFAHTGGSYYKEGVTKIPNVTIANPDADQIARLIALDKDVSVNINVQTESLGEGTGYNVIGQFNGTENPEQYVLIGGHLDSWDLGTGALDDGAGVALTMAAAKHISDVKRPKRSIRVVLFAAEELGLWGAKAYFAKHKNELSNIVAAAESDFGADVVYAFESNVSAESLPVVRAIAEELSPLNIEHIGKNQANGGPDLIPLKAATSAPIFELAQDGTDYFDYHHTADDTLDKVTPAKLRQNTAAYAVFALMAADAKTTIKPKAQNK